MEVFSEAGTGTWIWVVRPRAIDRTAAETPVELIVVQAFAIALDELRVIRREGGRMPDQ